MFEKVVDNKYKTDILTFIYAENIQNRDIKGMNQHVVFLNIITRQTLIMDIQQKEGKHINT